MRPADGVAVDTIPGLRAVFNHPGSYSSTNQTHILTESVEDQTPTNLKSTGVHHVQLGLWVVIVLVACITCMVLTFSTCPVQPDMHA